MSFYSPHLIQFIAPGFVLDTELTGHHYDSTN